MLNTREFPEKAGRIYPPLAILQYGQATQDDLKSGKEFQFEFSINYEMEMKESKKDIEVWKQAVPSCRKGKVGCSLKAPVLGAPDF